MTVNGHAPLSQPYAAAAQQASANPSTKYGERSSSA
jgi:hypothetical protein